MTHFLSEILPSPFLLFEKWYEEACVREPRDPNAFVLSTASRNAEGEGRPSSRVVLLKSMVNEQFVFYSHSTSKKGKEMSENPYVSMCFYWKSLSRQVRIEGLVSHLSDEESDAYFASRPIGAQIGAWASLQSQSLRSRTELERRILEYEKKFTPGPIPRPESWIGYQVYPYSMEFWVEGQFRLHERLVYKREKESTDWSHGWLYP